MNLTSHCHEKSRVYHENINYLLLRQFLGVDSFICSTTDDACNDDEHEDDMYKRIYDITDQS